MSLYDFHVLGTDACLREGVAEDAAALVAALVRGGFDERRVARWFEVPLSTEARYVRPPAERVRRGVGGWIALGIAGEEVNADLLRIPGLVDGELLARGVAALRALGLVEARGERLRARVALTPVGGVVIASDRLDAAGVDGAVGAPDLSGLQTAACLPRRLAGRRLLDVGTGAGVVALVAARRGARVVGGDVDRRALAFARLNAALNGVAGEAVRFVESDLDRGVDESERFDVVVWNAPLLAAPLASSDPTAARRYVVAEGAAELACAFVDSLARRVAPGGEALLHAQLVPSLVARLEALAREAQVVSLQFAFALDGTPHALTVVRPDGPRGFWRVPAPLGPICPHLERAIVDGALGPRVLPDDIEGATVVPAPWLELRVVRKLLARGQRGFADARFGGVPIDGDERALLERLDGSPLGELFPEGVDAVTRARLDALVARGLVLVV
jgi:SAM-dependent methyltransferase